MDCKHCGCSDMLDALKEGFIVTEDRDSDYYDPEPGKYHYVKNYWTANVKRLKLCPWCGVRFEP